MGAFDPGTSQGHVLLGDWQIFLWTAAIVGAIVVVLILLPLFLWRRRDGAAPARFQGNPPLEIAYTILPLLIVLGLFWVTLTRERRVEAQTPTPYAVVHVDAFRWSWRFVYPAEGVVVTGTPQHPPEMALPLGETTGIVLVSDDVDHSFWVPDFLFKRDAIPGFVNRFDLTPTRAGVFRGECAEFCGLGHTDMTFSVRVLPLPAYRAWLAAHRSAAP